jgi:hypothetical protein
VRDLASLVLHLVTTIARLVGPGGARSVVPPEERNLLRSKPVKTGLDNARETFASEHLSLPPVPERFTKNLRVIGEWCFATRKVDAMRMYLFDDYLNEVLTEKTPDYVAFSHAGHGINSYALNYQLVDGPLAVIAQVGWGGGYSDKTQDTQQANDLFARCAELISASERAKARGLTGPPGRLIVIESDMRQEWVCGWLNGPLRGPAVREWLREHSVTAFGDSLKIRETHLPTVAALKWLNAAPGVGSNRNSRPRSKS